MFYLAEVFLFRSRQLPKNIPLTGTSVELSRYWRRSEYAATSTRTSSQVSDIFRHTFMKFHLVLWHAAVLDFLQDNIFVQRSICLPPWSSQWQPGQEWTWIQFSLCKVVFSVSVGCSWIWFLLQEPCSHQNTIRTCRYCPNRLLFITHIMRRHSIPEGLVA